MVLNRDVVIRKFVCFSKPTGKMDHGRLEELRKMLKYMTNRHPIKS